MRLDGFYSVASAVSRTQAHADTRLVVVKQCTVPTIASGVPSSGAEIALICKCRKHLELGGWLDIDIDLEGRWRGSKANRAAQKGLDLLDNCLGLRPNVQRLCVGGAADKLTTLLAILTLRIRLPFNTVLEGPTLLKLSPKGYEASDGDQYVPNAV